MIIRSGKDKFVPKNTSGLITADGKQFVHPWTRQFYGLSTVKVFKNRKVYYNRQERESSWFMVELQWG